MIMVRCDLRSTVAFSFCGTPLSFESSFQTDGYLFGSPHSKILSTDAVHGETPL
jgi:hypothetical protein